MSIRVLSLLTLSFLVGCKSPTFDQNHPETGKLEGYRMLVLYDMPDNPQAFLDHYNNVHVPLTRKVKGLRVFEYGRIDSVPLPVGTAAPYWFSAEIIFDDAAAFNAAMQSTEAGAALADVPNLAPPSKIHFLVGNVNGEFPDLKTPPSF